MSKTASSPLVTIKTKYQVTLPTTVRKQAGLAVGDILEAKVEGKKITLTPKSIIDRELALALEDLRAGRTYGPFESVDELMRSLRANAKKHKRIKSSH